MIVGSLYPCLSSAFKFTGPLTISQYEDVVSLMQSPQLLRVEFARLQLQFLSRQFRNRMTGLDVAATLDLMMAPGRRRLQFLAVEDVAVNDESDVARFVVESLYPLCQRFEALDSVETDPRSEFLFSLEFTESAESTNGERVPIPWEQLFGGRRSHVVRMDYPQGYEVESNSCGPSAMRREWTAFRWENLATGRVMNMVVNFDWQESLHYYFVPFYFTFEQ